MNSLLLIGIIGFVIILVILINTVDKPYSIDDHHNDIMKDYDEEKWIKYQETKEFKNSNL